MFNGTDVLSTVLIVQNFYTPILVTFGTIGNILSIYILYKSKLRNVSSSYYLYTLCVSDTLFLINLILLWLRNVNIDLFNQPILCQTLIYQGSTNSCLSIWVIVAFTIERFLAVKYPLQSKQFSTKVRAKLVIKSLIVASCAFYVPHLFMAGVKQSIYNMNRTECALKDDWHTEADIFNDVDTIVTFIIPFLIIAILNTYICKNLWAYTKIRRRLTDSNDNNACIVLKSSYNMTKMLLIVSTACIILCMPSYIVRFIVYLKPLDETIAKFYLLEIQQVSHILFHTSFGMNFALYCISGQNFRRATRVVFCGENNDDANYRRDNRSLSTSSAYRKKRLTVKTSNECGL